MPTADLGPAGNALIAAGRRSAASGTFRLRIAADLGQSTAGGLSLAGLGESESLSRFQVSLTITLSGQVSTSERISYDGISWSRSQGGPWQKAVATPTGDPRRYLNYLSGASAVTDLGAADRGGIAAEKYGATLRLPAPSPRPGTGPAASVIPATLVAYVDQAGGRLIGEDINYADAATSTNASVHIDFYDFGAAIKITPPSAPGGAAPSPS